MFKLVEFLFMLGNTDGEPVHAMTYNYADFPSHELCMAFVDTEVGKAATGAIKVVAQSRQLEVRFSCVKAEDNSI